MLPDINTDDGYMGYHSVSSYSLGGRIDALRRGSWLAVVTTSKVFLALLYPNHPHPDPWTAAVLVLTSFFRFSNDPKSFSTWDLKVE